MSLYQRILVPIDGSDTAFDGLEEAVALATLTKGQIHLVHVIDRHGFMDFHEAGSADWLGLMDEAGAAILQDAEDRVRSRWVGVTTLMIDGVVTSVAEELVEQASLWHADIIVLGTHGRRGIRRTLLGSTAESVVRIATTPVLLVRPAGRLQSSTHTDHAATIAMPANAELFPE